MKWLKAEGFEAMLHDLRADGLDGTALDRWIAAVGWEILLNRRGTTWRGLADAEKADVDGVKARALMLAHPALIKRPVFEIGGRVIVGFGATEKAALKGTI